MRWKGASSNLGVTKKIFVTIKSLSQQIFVSINLCFNKFFVLLVMFSAWSSAWGLQDDDDDDDDDVALVYNSRI